MGTTAPRVVGPRLVRIAERVLVRLALDLTPRPRLLLPVEVDDRLERLLAVRRLAERDELLMFMLVPGCCPSSVAVVDCCCRGIDAKNFVLHFGHSTG